MKNHFTSLFDSSHLKRTIYLFAAGSLLIILSCAIGFNDNLPVIAMLLTGIVILFFAVLHPWSKTGNYAILAGVCTGILLLEWVIIHTLAARHLNQVSGEDVALRIAFFILVPGLLTGITGVIICLVKTKNHSQIDKKKV